MKTNKYIFVFQNDLAATLRILPDLQMNHIFASSALNVIVVRSEAVVAVVCASGGNGRQQQQIGNKYFLQEKELWCWSF